MATDTVSYTGTVKYFHSIGDIGAINIDPPHGGSISVFGIEDVEPSDIVAGMRVTFEIDPKRDDWAINVKLIAAT